MPDVKKTRPDVKNVNIYSKCRIRVLKKDPGSDVTVGYPGSRIPAASTSCYTFNLNFPHLCGFDGGLLQDM